jgi:hypothetical protein
LTVTAGGLKVTAGGLSVADGNVVITDELQVAGAMVVTGGLTVGNTGLTVTAGGITVTAGGLSVAAGDVVITDELQVADGISVTGGLTVENTGLTVTAGGISVTAGGISVTGGLTVGNSVLTIGSGGGGTGFTLSSDGTGTYSDTLSQHSDRRLKQNIRSLQNSLMTVKQLRGVTYDWNRTIPGREISSEKRQVGVIAQELQRLLPDLVNSDNEYLSVNYVGLVPVLVEAVKELEAKHTANAEVVRELKERDSTRRKLESLSMHHIETLARQDIAISSLEQKLETLSWLLTLVAVALLGAVAFWAVAFYKRSSHHSDRRYGVEEH